MTVRLQSIWTEIGLDLDWIGFLFGLDFYFD